MIKTIIFDIGHPLEVHALKDIIIRLTKEDFKIIVVARDKDLTFHLLNEYGIPYISRGTGQVKLFRKILYLFRTVYFLLKICKKNKPDLLVGFASPYLGVLSLLTKIHCIALDDTESNVVNWWFYAPFSKSIITPYCFPRKMSSKQIRFHGNFEISYLHPKRFIPDKSILQRLGLLENEKYIIIRFVNHSALHDYALKGITEKHKIEIVNKLSHYIKVFISSEIPLCKELEPFKFSLNPIEMHNAMAFASLVLGESPSMAAEAAIMGIPAILLDPNGRCFTEDLEKKFGLVYTINPRNINIDRVTTLALYLLNNYSADYWRKKSLLFLKETIDVNAFILWFIKNYPKSHQIMIQNPEYQNRFR